MKQRRWVWLWPMLALGALALAAAASLGLGRRSGTVDRGLETATAPVQRRTMERSVMATGVIRPVVGAEVDVGSRVSGSVLELPVKVGDVVEAGDLLVQLDPRAFDAALRAAEAEVHVARAELELAEARWRRNRRLVSQGILPSAERDVAQRDRTVGMARLETAEARWRGAEIERGYSRVVAPIRGVIAEVATRRGETVAASFAAPTFVTIVDLDRLEVRAYVDETDVGRIFLGQGATFTVDTYPQIEVEAVVRAIDPKAEIQGSVVNYVVSLDFTTPEGWTLRPEMTAHVRFRLQRRQDVLVVPRQALQRRDGRNYVRLWRPEGWVEREVETGWRDDHGVEIRRGLRPGEQVVLNGATLPD